MPPSATLGGHNERVCMTVGLYVCPLACLNKSSAVAEMGDRLATIETGRKVGGCCASFRRGTWVPI